MKTVIILGTWSSGSTALTGYIERLGAYTCPPHVMTYDERTPNSHESIEFRNALAAHVDELTLKPLQPAQNFNTWFKPWLAAKQDEAAKAGHSVIALKHPLSAFMVPQIAEACDPTFIVITRRFEAIEKTRLRRKWHQVYGAAGAGTVYSSLFSGLIQAQRSYYTIAFDDFLSNPEARQTLRSHLPQELATANVQDAENWLKI
ncbi:hypothetical protein [Actibacterium sp.]|uniref:hypothetical protein n=1 Tax=Actibacterium sp. TaxID=1872125 RepID=UPI00356A0941